MYNIALIGEAGIGKTSLLRYIYTNSEYDAKNSTINSTIGHDFCVKKIKDENGYIKPIKFIDCTGDRRCEYLIPQSIRDADVIIICYDLTKYPPSYTLNLDLLKYINKWMRTVDQYIEPHYYMILGLKRDKLDYDQLKIEFNYNNRLLRHFKKFFKIDNVFNCSIYNTDDSKNNINKLKKVLLQHIKKIDKIIENLDEDFNDIINLDDENSSYYDYCYC